MVVGVPPHSVLVGVRLGRVATGDSYARALRPHQVIARLGEVTGSGELRIDEQRDTGSDHDVAYVKVAVAYTVTVHLLDSSEDSEAHLDPLIGRVIRAPVGQRLVPTRGELVAGHADDVR